MENIAQKDQELARMIEAATVKMEAASAGVQKTINKTQAAVQHINGIEVNMPTIDMSGVAAAKRTTEAAIAGIPRAIQQIQGIQLDLSGFPQVHIQPIPQYRFSTAGQTASHKES